MSESEDPEESGASEAAAAELPHDIQAQLLQEADSCDALAEELAQKAHALGAQQVDDTSQEGEAEGIRSRAGSVSTVDMSEADPLLSAQDEAPATTKQRVGQPRWKVCPAVHAGLALAVLLLAMLAHPVFVEPRVHVVVLGELPPEPKHLVLTSKGKASRFTAACFAGLPNIVLAGCCEVHAGAEGDRRVDTVMATRHPEPPGGEFHWGDHEPWHVALVLEYAQPGDYWEDHALRAVLKRMHRWEVAVSVPFTRASKWWGRPSAVQCSPLTPRIKNDSHVGQLHEAAEHLGRWHRLANRPVPIVMLELVRRSAAQQHRKQQGQLFEAQLRGLMQRVAGQVLERTELTSHPELLAHGYNWNELMLTAFPSKQAYFELASSAQYERVYHEHEANVRAHVVLAIRPFVLGQLGYLSKES
eukprot:TRINITY_DN3552_c0_g1_i3.p1 TRINITY_DN3552_c0_g1~~TRINITY_DN3552_c0_g1_i3.p1  ORF type:complete len:416 (-),score=111.86 TRINITY_DN3552_c0_g1_i3:30-1277(-)